MNQNYLKYLSQHFNLGQQVKTPERVCGGLLHTMWRLDTDKGSYAIKQLSKDIDLQNERVFKNYELSETIASHFLTHGIEGICAIAQAGKYLFMVDETGFLVYPWVHAKALDQDAVSEPHALKIASILAKMHCMNLHIEGVDEPAFDVYESQYITDLIKQAIQEQPSFAEILNSNLFTLLKMNENYLDSIEILKNHTVISHGDLDQKNVLWTDNNQPLLIDWESARKLNPTYEIVNAALDWSGVTTSLNMNLFHEMLKSYTESGGFIEKNMMKAAFYGVIGNWIHWMVYNVNRAITQENMEQKNIGVEQVIKVLPTILRVEALMPELINEFK